MREAFLEGVQQCVHAVRTQGTLGPLDHVAKEPAIDPRGQDPYGAGTTGSQAGGEGGGNVPQFRGNAPNPLLCLRAHGIQVT